MHLHLQFPVDPLPQKMRYKNPTCLFGSCFASEMGELLKRYKFNAIINPHGILYDPQSISASVADCIEAKVVTDKDLFFHLGLWRSFRHHGSFSHPDKAQCLSAINSSIAEMHQALKEAQLLVITLGSAFFYRHIPTGKAVANCHKLAGTEFKKEMISEEEVIRSFGLLFQQLIKLHPSIQVVLTVSPVRYVRDGVIENNLSKAVLIKAVHALVREHSNVTYFPAYELVIDDLRDHRFYKEDLVHPNAIALNYVWEKFLEASLEAETKILYREVSAIIHGIEHRQLHPGSEESQEFFKEQLKKCELLSAKKGAPDLSAEQAFFRKALNRV
jgi:hypothetical protein